MKSASIYGLIVLTLMLAGFSVFVFSKVQIEGVFIPETSGIEALAQGNVALTSAIFSGIWSAIGDILRGFVSIF